MCALWWRPKEEQKALHGLSLIEVMLMSGMHLPWSIIFRQCNLFVFAVYSFVGIVMELSFFSVQAFHNFYFQIKVPDKIIQDWIEKPEWTLYRCTLALFTLHISLIWFSDPIFKTDCPHSATDPLDQTIVYRLPHTISEMCPK